MKYVFQLKSVVNIRFMTAAIMMMAAVLLSVNTAWAQHGCSGGCYMEPDYVTTITTKLPFAENETEVTVGVKDGIAYFEGDIILGKLSDLQRKGVARDDLLWTNSTIPYTIGGGFSSSQIEDINDAAENITNRTNLCIIPRTTEANYVNIITGSGCSAQIGMSGGAQNMELASGCDFGTILHEFLHIVGINHEQNRHDRDNFVTINWDNIDPEFHYAFNIADDNFTDYGAYDYNSIMHYHEKAFNINGQVTITTPEGISIGQRNGLSTGDIATINALYPFACNGDTDPCAVNRTISAEYPSGSNMDIKVSNSITANNEIRDGAKANYNAGSIVRLTPGFRAHEDSKFHAFIGGCNSASGGKLEETIVDDEPILRNYPNPFTGQTTIEFTLPKDTPVSLSVSDVTGKQIAVLLNNDEKTEGIHSITFDGNNYPAGMYYYTIQAGEYYGTQKMMLAK